MAVMSYESSLVNICFGNANLVEPLSEVEF